MNAGANADNAEQLCAVLTFPYPHPDYRVAYYCQGFNIFEKLVGFPNSYLWHLSQQFTAQSGCPNNSLIELKTSLLNEVQTYSASHHFGRWKSVLGGVSQYADFGVAICSPICLYEGHTPSGRVVHHNTLVMASSAGANVNERYLFRLVGRDYYDPMELPVRLDLW